MKLVLLVENNSLFDKYFHAEHGFSAYIEDNGVQVLYDTGYSDAFLKNAIQLGIDLTTIDYLILSHGHYDHSGGLKHLMAYYEKMPVYRKPTLLIGDEEIFSKRYNFEAQKKTGMDVTRDQLDRFFEIKVTSEPFKLTERLYFLGKPERTNQYERTVPKSKILKNGEYVDDFVDEEVQLAYLHKDGGISIITGCSHSGIVNIISHARKVTGAEKVHSVIGGFHLQKPPKDLLKFTLDFVEETGIESLYACHCTDFKTRMDLAKISNVCETGVSLQLNWD